MVEDPPVGVHVGARHGGDLLADASAGQAGRALQQPQYRERHVADEEVSLYVPRRPHVDGSRPEFGLRDPERLLYPPELPVGVDDLAVWPAGLAGDDEVVAVAPLGLGDGLLVELQPARLDDLPGLAVEVQVPDEPGGPVAGGPRVGARVRHEPPGLLDDPLPLAACPACVPLGPEGHVLDVDAHVLGPARRRVGRPEVDGLEALPRLRPEPRVAARPALVALLREHPRPELLVRPGAAHRLGEDEPVTGGGCGGDVLRAVEPLVGHGDDAVDAAVALHVG